MESWMDAIYSLITSRTGRPFEPAGRTGVGGGSISQGFALIGTDGRRYFVKRNHLRRLPMFEAEAAGLAELRQCSILHIPEALGTTTGGDSAFLVLENLELGGHTDGAALGSGVAEMHRITHSGFGWTMDNYIGSSPQPNTPDADWGTFYRDRRLAHQRRLARDNGARSGLLDTVARLEQELDAFFAGYRPAPSLLHGDLWSGNWGFLADGSPSVFDPAVYYGDREADVAMMELFGHPGAAFFAAYTAELPLDPGYRVRRDLYNLYHILNHFNLFGGGYAAQAENMARALLAELG